MNHINKIRQAVADYMATEGCGCCRGMDHDKHREALAKLLHVSKYPDSSGYNFARYRTKRVEKTVTGEPCSK